MPQRAGKHGQQVHEAVVQQGQLDLQHVQADEIRVKGRKMMAWMGLAMMVSTRLWFCTDGWSAYPGSMRRAFREKVKKTAGPGRACLQAWPNVCIATVIKRTAKKHVVEIVRQMTQGTLEQAQKLLQQSQGGTVLNTAFIERLNGTMRQRLASLTRKCRHAALRLVALECGMWLIGCTYTLCWTHHELSRRAAKAEARAWRGAVDSRDGQWPDRSRLEHPGTVGLAGGSSTLGYPETTRTTGEADGASHQKATGARRTLTPSPFTSSSERGLMLNHRLVESYRLSSNQDAPPDSS